MARSWDERGFVAAEWVAAVGALLIPVFILVLSVTRLPEVNAAAQSIATEAARAGAQQGSCNDAKAAANAVINGNGSGNPGLPQQLGVASLMDGPPTIDGSQWSAGGTFTVKVSMKMPVQVLPGVGFNLPLNAVTARHAEPIDRYRFIDEASCS